MESFGVWRRLHTRRRVLAVGACGAAAAMWMRSLPVASAAAQADATALETAAALESSALGLYARLAALPASVSGASTAFVAHLFSVARTHHVAHAATFNAAATTLGGTPQTGCDTAFDATVVSPGLAAVRGPQDALALAIVVEDTLAASQAAFVAVTPHAAALTALCSVAPVEAQHAAVLRAVAALLAAGAPELIVAPPDTQALPAQIGVAALPASFTPTAAARQAAEAPSR